MSCIWALARLVLNFWQKCKGNQFEKLILNILFSPYGYGRLFSQPRSLYFKGISPFPKQKKLCQNKRCYVIREIRLLIVNYRGKRLWSPTNFKGANKDGKMISVQGQKSEQKHITNNFAGLHNHFALLTIDIVYYTFTEFFYNRIWTLFKCN